MRVNEHVICGQFCMALDSRFKFCKFAFIYDKALENTSCKYWNHANILIQESCIYMFLLYVVHWFNLVRDEYIEIGTKKLFIIHICVHSWFSQKSYRLNVHLNFNKNQWELSCRQQCGGIELRWIWECLWLFMYEGKHNKKLKFFK